MHGAGYPLTFEFSVPDEADLRAQFRRSASSGWSDLPAAPEGRFDGLACARFAGTSAYLSAAWPNGSNELHLRILDATGAEVGDYIGTATHYDDRTASVVFTYDDTNVGIALAAQHHRAARLWMSPGINAGRLDREPYAPTGYTPAMLAADTAAGWLEPINHGWNHVNATTMADQAAADADIVGGKDGILADVAPTLLEMLGLAKPAQMTGSSLLVKNA